MSDSNNDLILTNEDSIELGILGNLINGFGGRDSSVEHRNAMSVVRLGNRELEQLYENAIIKRIVNIYPETAAQQKYNILGSNHILEEYDDYILELFTEASIQARLYGTAYLVFNPDNNYRMLKPYNKNAYLITNKLEYAGSKGWFNSRHPRITYQVNSDGVQREIEYIKKMYPDRNVFVFTGSKNYKSSYEYNRESFSQSVINPVYNALNDFLRSNSNSILILDNLSNLVIGIRELGLQIRSRDGYNRITNAAKMLDENRRLNKVIVHDADEPMNYISQHLDNVVPLLEHLTNVVAASTDFIPREKVFNYSRGSQGSGYYTHLIIRQQWAENVQKWAIANWSKNLMKFYSQFYTDQISTDFPLMNVMTRSEIAELEHREAQKNALLIDKGVFTAEEVKAMYLEHYHSNLTDLIS